MTERSSASYSKTNYYPLHNLSGLSPYQSTIPHQPSHHNGQPPLTKTPSATQTQTPTPSNANLRLHLHANHAPPPLAQHDPLPPRLHNEQQTAPPARAVPASVPVPPTPPTPNAPTGLHIQYGAALLVGAAVPAARAGTAAGDAQVFVARAGLRGVGGGAGAAGGGADAAALELGEVGLRAGGHARAGDGGAGGVGAGGAQAVALGGSLALGLCW